MGQVDQMQVSGIREVQVPLALQLAVEAVLGAQCIWSTEVSLERSPAGVNQNVNKTASLVRREMRSTAGAGGYGFAEFWIVVNGAPETEGCSS